MISLLKSSEWSHVCHEGLLHESLLDLGLDTCLMHSRQLLRQEVTWIIQLLSAYMLCDKKQYAQKLDFLAIHLMCPELVNMSAFLSFVSTQTFQFLCHIPFLLIKSFFISLSPWQFCWKIVLCITFCLGFILILFLSHSWWFSGVTPGSTLRNHSWQA